MSNLIPRRKGGIPLPRRGFSDTTNGPAISRPICKGGPPSPNPMIKGVRDPMNRGLGAPLKIKFVSQD